MQERSIAARADAVVSGKRPHTGVRWAVSLAFLPNLTPLALAAMRPALALPTIRCAERCHMIFREKASGKSTRGRPELDKAIDELGKSDVLVVPEWDGATRSMMDGVHLIERINARGGAGQTASRPRHPDRA
jgi:Resolvase, N terminal domain